MEEAREADKPYKFLFIVVLCSVMIIIGVGLVFWAMRNEKEVTVIDIRLSDNMSTPVDFDGLVLLPGQSTEYTLRFSSYSSRRYCVCLNFVEDEDRKAYNTLKHYVRAQITIGDEIAYDGLLENLIDDDPIRFPVNVRADLNTKVKIRYYLPDDIGNEAKGASAAFKLLVTAGNEDPEWDWD